MILCLFAVAELETGDMSCVIIETKLNSRYDY